MDLNKNSKGQYFSFDAIISSVIFILTLISLISYWQSVRSTLDYQNSEISKEAIRISDNLFLVGGNDCKTSLGFALSPNTKQLSDNYISSCSIDDIGLKKKFSTAFNVSIYFDFKTSGNGCSSDSYILGSDIKNPSAPIKIKNLAKVQRVASISCNSESSGLASVEVMVYE